MCPTFNISVPCFAIYRYIFFQGVGRCHKKNKTMGIQSSHIFKALLRLTDFKGGNLQPNPTGYLPQQISQSGYKCPSNDANVTLLSQVMDPLVETAGGSMHAPEPPQSSTSPGKVVVQDVHGHFRVGSSLNQGRFKGGKGNSSWDLTSSSPWQWHSSEGARRCNCTR